MNQELISNLTASMDLISERNRIIEKGTVEELIDLAKEYNIFQDTQHSRYYQEMVKRITDKLISFNVDINSIKE